MAEEAARLEEELATRQEEELAARQEEELAAQAAKILAEELEEEAESEIQAEVDPSDEQYTEEEIPAVEVAYEPEMELKEEATVKQEPAATLEAAEPEVFSAFSDDQVIEFDVQADEPIAQNEETVEAVAQQEAMEVSPESEIVEPVEEQIIYEAPEVISEPESLPVTEILEETQSESNEVEEPIQIAAEAFVVGQEEERVPEQNTELPSRMQNLEEADRLVDQVN